MKQVAELLRAWWADPAGRVVLALGLVCAMGPFGEILDITLLAELEVDLVTADLGLDALAGALLPVGWVLLFLIGTAAAARGLAVIACAADDRNLALVPHRAAPPIPVPIR